MEQASDYIFGSGYNICLPFCLDLRIYWCIWEYSVVLLGDSARCRGFIIVIANLHNYPTDKFVTGNNYLITYYILVTWESNIIPVCVDLRILVYSGEYYIELLGDIYNCRGFKIVSGIIHNYHRDKYVTWNKHLITYLGQGIIFASHSV
jgi:hypothetical protein